MGKSPALAATDPAAQPASAKCTTRTLTKVWVLACVLIALYQFALPSSTSLSHEPLSRVHQGPGTSPHEPHLHETRPACWDDMYATEPSAHGPGSDHNGQHRGSHGRHGAHGPHGEMGGASIFDAQHPNDTLHRLRHRALDLVSRDHLKHSIEYMFTSGPHLAAQNEELVNWTQAAIADAGFETNQDIYNIWLNYPVSHRVALLNSDGSVKTELSLEEPVLKEDPTTGRADRIPTFHGFSASGNVTGELIYAHLGRKQDYDRLIDEGISLEGKVVIVRYGGIFRGLKVKFAEELGAVAVLIYSDPAEDGEITEANGYKAYPDGPARHPESVQRGSVQDLSHAPGDPTTPGFPSTPENEANRTDPQGIPGIPSVPISYKDALPLLKALNGHGPKFDGWEGALKGIEYNIGPSKLSVNVDNLQDYDFRPNVDIIGRFEGETTEEIIIGNHRDAWIIGGADPNSGTAVLLEVARVFGELVKQGWKPRRTIVLASWDGEEYGLLGSTEWGEDHAQALQKNAVAYINCDVGASGRNFDVSANPLLHYVIESTAHRVDFNGSTLSEYWGGSGHQPRFSPLGSGSDYTVFQDHLGIPSLDVGFAGGAKSPIYHYHSNYDSLYWMQHFGDPELTFHEGVTKFVALAALELIEGDIIPFSIVQYAKSVRRSIRALLNFYEGPANEEVGTLFVEVHRFVQQAKQFSKKAHHLKRRIHHLERKKGFWNTVKLGLLKLKLARQSSKLRSFDQNFLYSEGLDNRPWFKHIIYAPGRYTGYAGQVFPGIAESLEDGDGAGLVKWVSITTDALKKASDSLS